MNTLWLAFSGRMITGAAAWAGIGGILCALWLIFSRRDSKSALLGIFTLALLLPFTGIVNFIWENMSASYAANFRYTLHWYPFAAACLALALLHLLKLAKTPEPKRFSAILLTLLALKGITLGWKTSDGVWLNKNLRALTQAQIESGDKNVRVADDRFRYYIPEAGPAQGFPLLYQSQVDELQKLYDRLDIGVIALSKNNQEFWDKTVLGKAVQDSDFAYLSSETDWQRIYVVGHATIEKRRQATQPELTQALASVSYKMETAKTSPAAPYKAFKENRLSLPTKEVRLPNGSISAWAHIDGPYSNYHTLLRANLGNDLYIYHTGLNGGTVVFYCGTLIGTSVAVPAAQWHHYLLSWNDGKQVLYVDGQALLQDNLPACDKKVDFAWLGRLDVTDTKELWNGELCAVTLFDRNLTEQESRALYISGNPCGKY